LRFHDQNGARPSLDKLLSPQALFIGTRLADEWRLDVGSTLRIASGMRQYDVVVAGLIKSDAQRPSVWDTVGIMDIAAAQALFGLIGRLDRIDIVTEPGRPVEKVIDELRALLPPAVTVSRPAGRTDQIEQMTRAFQLNLTVLSMVSLLVGLFLVYNTVSFAVVRRRREIGMLSAMGMSRRAVTILFISEAAAMGLFGGVLGSGCGVLLAKSLMSQLSRTISDLYISIDTSVADVSLIRFVVELPLSVWAEGAALGAIVSMIGAFVPSWDAGQTAPARALAPGDYESTQTARISSLGWTGLLLIVLAGLCAVPGPIMGLPLFGYGAALCLLLGLSCLIPLVIHLFGSVWVAVGQAHAPSGRRTRLPLLARLAADHVSRAPGRNAVTISAMMVGISIMVGVDTMVGSFRETVREWIDQTVLADLIVAPATWLHGHETGQLANRIPPSWAKSLTGLPGVAAIDTYRDVSVDLKGRRVALVSRDLRVHAERSRYLMVHGNSSTVLNEAVAKDGVIISEVLARTAGLHTGEMLRLTTPVGEHEFPILGIFFDYATDGGKIVMDRRVYQRLWQDETTTVIPIYVETGADRAVVRRLLEERVRGMAGSSDGQTPLMVISNTELRQEIMTIFDRTFTVTYVLELIAIIIAVLGIINTLVLSVLQRRREFAMLRSLGTTMLHIRRLMLWESGYLGLLGGVLGVVGGMLLSVLLIEVINKQSFGWTIRFSVQPLVVVQALVLALGAAFVAAYIPARWAGKQSIAEGLRYE
ncbi:MAG TPA: FtsX-like permease family protein, partial [Nitrospiraceae bacterium]|nr:FtsX-like permease family protein [Nitrospiraceae bacterium]